MVINEQKGLAIDFSTDNYICSLQQIQVVKFHPHNLRITMHICKLDMTKRILFANLLNKHLKSTLSYKSRFVSLIIHRGKS